MKLYPLLFYFILMFHNTFSQIGGYAVKFDGTNDYVAFTSGNSPSYSNSAFTIEAWINSTSTRTEEEIVSWGYGSGSTNVVEFRMDQGKLQFGMDVGGWSVVTSTASVNTGNWVHVAATKSGNTVKLYINGKLDVTGTITATPSVNQMTIANVFQNGTYQSNRYEFLGQIDEVRIWNVVRTEAEIKANMFKEIGTNANLIGYYKMSDGTGTTLTDNSGNSKTGTLTNGPNWVASGCFAGSRQALDFDGTDDYVNLPTGFSSAFNGLQHFSFCGWVYPTFLSNNLWGTFFTRYSISPATRVTFHQLPEGYGGNSDDIFISVDNGTYYGEAYTTSNVLELNKWVHLAVVYDGTQSTNELKIKIYVNGKLVNLTFPSGTYFPTSFSSTNQFAYLGRYNNPDYFKGGKFDEFSFWNVSLTESQIHEIMFRNLSGNESGLFAYYRFNQTDGTTLYDMTSNGYNGTLTNMDAATDWVSSSAFNTWIGSESSTWSTASNWSSGSAPASTDNVGLYKWDLGSEAAISGTPTVNHLFVSSTASPTLSSNFTVNGNLILENNINLAGQNINLGSSGYLLEGNGRAYGSSGIIFSERNWGAPSGLNAAGLGLIITSSNDVGMCTISRGHAEQTGNGNKSILRYYKIIEEAKTPSSSPALNKALGGDGVEITFKYLDSELNGLNENNLILFKSTDNGVNWMEEGGVLNTIDNTVTLSGITNLDGTYWTLGSTAFPLPVELISFSAKYSDGRTKLNWQTATEVNNYGFEIQRLVVSDQISAKNWQKIGFNQAYGNSNSPKSYSFVDVNPIAGNVQYRLKQIDNDGVFMYSDIVEVNIANPVNYSLEQNYPNPFNPITTINYQLPKRTNVTIKVFDAIGSMIETLVQSEQQAGNYFINWDASKYSSGLYYYELIAGEFREVKKMILIK